ncbi:CPBP family glutamic-type intramembrane protease [Dehalococcoidia bacterium]|nr:CPBP family glutamic-type intramembrane protease [Dehalococcoidia bacterium]MCL0104606.1 CPBP family glutamic-type intramembrane protease [Dehalococcoidia bacterium]
MIISVPVVIATLAVMRVLEFGADDVGFAVRRLPLQIAVALTGVPLGLAGYLILEPQTLVIGLTWGDMVLPGTIFVVCVGFVQELIFRGVMQRASGEVLGRWGILYISLLFAILSTGQLSVLNMVFMFRVAPVPLHFTRYTLIRTPATLNLEP